MSSNLFIPMFPLSALPLPEELIPLHIFEPRYRQLLQDMETNDITFGIYLSHQLNTQKIGSLMRLRSIIKRYPGGESDIVVSCENIFSTDLLMRNYKHKLYPGGEVQLWDVDFKSFPGQTIYETFLGYLKLRNIKTHVSSFNIYQMAVKLSLDLYDRYKFLIASPEGRESFLHNRIKFLIHVLDQENKSKDFYHLN